MDGIELFYLFLGLVGTIFLLVAVVIWIVIIRRRRKKAKKLEELDRKRASKPACTKQ